MVKLFEFACFHLMLSLVKTSVCGGEIEPSNRLITFFNILLFLQILSSYKLRIPFLVNKV